MRTRLGFLLSFGFVVFLAMGIAVSPAEAQSCYNCTCTDTSIRQCVACKESECEFHYQQCLQWAFGGGEECQGQKDSCNTHANDSCEGYCCGHSDDPRWQWSQTPTQRGDLDMLLVLRQMIFAFERAHPGLSVCGLVSGVRRSEVNVQPIEND